MGIAQIELKPAAAEIHRSDAQIKVVFSSRRFGKTRLMLTAGIEECLTNPGAKVLYLAPSRKQAKDIAWAELKTMVPTTWLDRIYESQLALHFRNGSKLILAGADYADGLLGQAANLILCDEFAYVADLQEMWEGALLPMLGTTRGRVVFCSTPAGGGNFASELWDRAKNTPGWQRWSFKSTDGGWIDDTFVQEAKCTMDPILWRQEFEASIESLLGAVYPDFNRQNITPTDYWQNERLVFGVDFNRTPFCGCILQVQGDRLAVLKEYVLINSGHTRDGASGPQRLPVPGDFVLPGPNRPQAPNLISDGAERSRDPAEIQLPHQGTPRPLEHPRQGERHAHDDPRCQRPSPPESGSQLQTRYPQPVES